MTRDVIVTCPPMLGQLDRFTDFAAEKGLTLHPANTTQVLSEDELCELIGLKLDAAQCRALSRQLNLDGDNLVRADEMVAALKKALSQSCVFGHILFRRRENTPRAHPTAASRPSTAS